jgi:prevent-host-death family protein
MNEVGAYEAKTHLAQLLKRVSRGERFTITKHGVPVAVLLPAVTSDAPPVVETIDALRRFRAGHRLDGLRLRDLIEQGRR